MIVCSCNVLSDHAIRRAADGRDWPGRVSEVFGRHGCRPQCGRCAPTIRDLLRDGPAGERDRCPVVIDDVAPTLTGAGNCVEPMLAAAE